MLAEKAMEVDFFQRCLQKARLAPDERQKLAGGHSTKCDEVMYIARQLEYRGAGVVTRVSRASFFVLSGEAPVEERDGITTRFRRLL